MRGVGAVDAEEVVVGVRLVRARDERPVPALVVRDERPVVPGCDIGVVADRPAAVPGHARHVPEHVARGAAVGDVLVLPGAVDQRLGDRLAEPGRGFGVPDRGALRGVDARHLVQVGVARALVRARDDPPRRRRAHRAAGGRGGRARAERARAGDRRRGSGRLRGRETSRRAGAGPASVPTAPAGPAVRASTASSEMVSTILRFTGGRLPRPRPAEPVGSDNPLPIAPRIIQSDHGAVLTEPAETEAAMTEATTPETPPHHPRWKRIVATVLVVVELRAGAAHGDRDLGPQPGPQHGSLRRDGRPARLQPRDHQRGRRQHHRDALRAGQRGAGGRGKRSPSGPSSSPGRSSVGIRGFTEQAAVRILESDVFERLVGRREPAGPQPGRVPAHRWRGGHLHPERARALDLTAVVAEGARAPPGPWHHDLRFDPDQPAGIEVRALRRRAARRGAAGSQAAQHAGVGAAVRRLRAPRRRGRGSPPTGVAPSSGGASGPRSRCR